MANAKKCDRCGKYYDLKDRREIVNHPKFSEQHRKLVWIRCFDHLDRRIGDFDLCDDCAEKLYKFLCNEPEQGEGNKSKHDSPVGWDEQKQEFVYAEG